MEPKTAAPYKRLLAVLIDILLVVPLVTIGVLFTNYMLALPVTPDLSNYGLEVKMDNWAQQHFWQLVILYSAVKIIVLAGYYIPAEASKWQGTPGKRLLKIKVTDLEAQRISHKKSVLRFFSKILSAQFLIGYIMILFTKQKQGLHDFIAKTLVQEK